ATQPLHIHSYPTRRSSDLHAEKVNSLNAGKEFQEELEMLKYNQMAAENAYFRKLEATTSDNKSVTKSPLELSDGHFRIYENADQMEEHTSELQSRENLVCR